MKKELKQLDRSYRLKKQQLNAVTDALTQAYRGFNLSCDDSATEGCIFEIEALRRRRNSILQDMQDIERTKHDYYF